MATIEYILVGAAIFTSAFTFVLRIAFSVSVILEKWELVMLWDLKTFIPLTYSKTIEIIFAVRFLFCVPYFSTRRLPQERTGMAIRSTTHSAIASFQLIKNVPISTRAAITTVFTIDGSVCVITSSKLVKSFVSVPRR